MKVYILSEMDFEDNTWEVLSVHKTEKSAEKQLLKVAEENEYDNTEKEQYLSVDEYALLD